MTRTLTSRSESLLNLLAVFHTLLAALQAVAAMFLIAYTITSLGEMESRLSAASELRETVEWSFVVWPILSVALAATLAALTFFAGRRLAERRARSFCLTVAAINSFFFPLGTALGIPTIIVLKRPAVRQAFTESHTHPNVAAWEGTKLP